MTTAAALALFAAVLAWPVPRLLAGARWTHGCPRAAIVLWQAIGLAGGVCALLAAVAFTVAPLSGSTPRAITHHVHNLAKGRPLSGLDWLSVIGLGLVAALASRLFGVLAASTVATLRRRSHHRHLVDLTGDDHTEDCRAAAGPADLPAGAPRSRHSRIQDWTPLASIRHAHSARNADGCELCGHVGLRILDHPVAVAYCVPGVRHARVVVSRGLLTTLSPRELRAVLAHEDAHVTGRHDLVIQPFIAWQQTFPFLRPAWEATAAVSLLVEMLADDAAARRTSGKTLARALAQLGVTRALIPAGTLGVSGESTEADPPSRSPVIARIVRLLDPPAVPWWQPAAAYTAAAVILAIPFVLLAV